MSVVLGSNAKSRPEDHFPIPSMAHEQSPCIAKGMMLGSKKQGPRDKHVLGLGEKLPKHSGMIFCFLLSPSLVLLVVRADIEKLQLLGQRGLSSAFVNKVL